MPSRLRICRCTAPSSVTKNSGSPSAFVSTHAGSARTIPGPPASWDASTDGPPDRSAAPRCSSAPEPAAVFGDRFTTGHELPQPITARRQRQLFFPAPPLDAATPAWELHPQRISWSSRGEITWRKRGDVRNGRTSFIGQRFGYRCRRTGLQVRMRTHRACDG